ncbi:DNA translocase FtsK [Pseudalkalibacillus berkeleyi]|uniref:FtsK domain-containing protein n=1 Tax=Pseudalkalibacillus berkeleyi TaxID=1069813 RepID=A0ABS9H3C8_9BACL|nr:DNA translocase FtsK [Pseudalkalibacillus berkeleyi]MCF6138308.1 hypothetical protein [Pseudalkalibacillus berkeleyi]
MSKWLKKMMDLILEDEDEKNETQHNEPQSKKSKRKQDQTKTIGRMQDSKRTIEPKMKHQYPKEGNFRFPLIPDEEKNRTRTYRQSQNQQPESNRNRDTEPKETEKENIKRSQSVSSTRTSREATERPKFTGVNFTPSDIPSPIYGFGERPEVFPPQYGDGRQEEFTSYEPGYETLKAIDEEYEEFESENMIEDVKMEYPSEMEDDEQVFSEEEIDLQFAVETHMNDEIEADDDQEIKTIFELEKDENQEESYNSSVSDDEPNEGENTEEDQVTYDEIDTDAVIKAGTEHDEDDGGTYTNENTETDTDTDLDDQIEQPTAEAHPKQETQEEQQQKEMPSEKKKKRNPIGSEQKKSMIPFNVMMLQRDRNSKESNKPNLKSANHTPTQSNTQSQPEQKVERQQETIRQSNQVQVHHENYEFPSAQLLDAELFEPNDDDTWLDDQIDLLQSTLDNFNVKAKVLGATKGPSVTRIEVQPAPGVKVNKITNLSDDIKLSLAAKDIRIEAPIPGKNAIGIEVPNSVSKAVPLREIITHPNFNQNSSPLSVALGLDISGQPVVTDLQKMPHGLIAGATGSGKSVCINSLLISILYKSHPDDVRLLLIDPKMVELAPYNQLPHLVTPVITDAKEATQGLKWAVDEMERRYELFAKSGVRDMERFNKLVKEKGDPDQKLPYIVVVIDELADLMMVSPQEVEDSICRIAQKARACGIHLLLATQRPSVDVITGLIKANIPTRVAFAVSSSVDSRTIIDTNGADKLLGKGDMLFLGNGVSKPVRIQGNFVSDDEIERITDHVKRQRDPDYFFEREELIQSTLELDQSDELFDEACEFVLEQGAASSSSLQRRFRIGYNRAARLIDMMEAKGFVSEAMGSKPRNVLITKAEYFEHSGEEIKR